MAAGPSTRRPVSASASSRFGVTSVARGRSRARRTCSASGSRRASPLVARRTGSTTRAGTGRRPSASATTSTTAGPRSMPVFAARTSRSSRTAASCWRTSSGGTAMTARTPRVSCTVSAVRTLAPCTPKRANVTTPAWIPAPPLGSEPAIVSATARTRASIPAVDATRRPRYASRLLLQQGREPMAIQIGDIAPDFEADTTEGHVKFHEWIGDRWCVLMSHPKDFTPVCTTELGRVANLKQEFEKRKAKAIAVSVDDVKSHKGWIGDIEETQKAKMNFPIIGDPERKVANLYGMIHPNANDTLTVRSVFFIDPNKKVRAMITYPASTGRNFDEIMRVLDSLQLTDKYSVATPVNWKQGEDCVIVPSLTDAEEIKKKFPKGYKALKPYLRMTPQPPHTS